MADKGNVGLMRDVERARQELRVSRFTDAWALRMGLGAAPHLVERFSRELQVSAFALRRAFAWDWPFRRVNMQDVERDLRVDIDPWAAAPDWSDLETEVQPLGESAFMWMGSRLSPPIYWLAKYGELRSRDDVVFFVLKAICRVTAAAKSLECGWATEPVASTIQDPFEVTVELETNPKTKEFVDIGAADLNVVVLLEFATSSFTVSFEEQQLLGTEEAQRRRAIYSERLLELDVAVTRIVDLAQEVRAFSEM